ncbi:MAG: hypothetical protein JWN78_3376 [Bacteroidota bacterium]|nr:hypothetical protein [Bacteroidota bacterium]
MKNIKSLFFSILFFGILNASAENIYFNFKDGTQGVYPVSEVRSITFTGSTMHLNKRDGSVISWDVNDIGHYNYNLATILQPVLSKNPEIKIYPNPSNRSVTINYTLTDPVKVVFEIWDISGNRVKQLIQNNSLPGSYMMNWDGNNDSGAAVSAGSYICSMTIGKETISRKITIINK